MSGVADRPQRWSRSESCVARAGCPPPDRRESTDSGGAPWVRLPTSWERVVPSARPTPVTSCPPYSCRGRSRIRDCLVSSNSAAAKARWLSVLGQGGVWTHSSATNRRESRGQPKDRNSQGGPYAAGPDVRRSLSKRSGRRCCAETGCRVPTCRAATRGRGSLPSLGLPSGPRTVAAVHAVREFDCLDASSPCLCSSNAAHTRAGKGRFDARPGNCIRARPRVGWARPASGCFSHGHTPSRPAAIAQRTYVPGCRRRETGVRGGRQLVEPCAPLFTVAPLDLTYPPAGAAKAGKSSGRGHVNGRAGGARGHRFVQCSAELDGWVGSMRPLVMVSLARSISGPACGGQSPERSAFLVEARVRFVAAICPRRSGRGVRRADRCPQPSR